MLPIPIATKLRAILSNTRTLETLFPSYFEGVKRNHYSDFGWPTSIRSKDFFLTYTRNAVAGAAIDLTASKTWQDNPDIWESEEPAESGLEKTIRQRMEDLRLWHHAREADVRSMVSGYAALIFRFADGMEFNQPVRAVSGGVNGLVEVIPAWAHELTVGKWGTDPKDGDTYGKPVEYLFDEGTLYTSTGQQSPGRKLTIHPDRVLIWSQDGTVYGRSKLMQGYNSLITLEKVEGASGEGFWKNSKSAPIFSAPENTTIEALATAMGVPASEVGDKLDEMVKAYQEGSDASLLLFGLKREPTSVTLPSPEHFYNIALQSFAASVGVPLKILVGTQTGERASSEDAKQWAQHNKSRRESVCRPMIREMLNRFERFGVIPERDWTIDWTDLTESSQEERLNMAAKMAEIHSKMSPDPVFMANEIREVTGHDPREDIEGFDLDPDPEAPDAEPGSADSKEDDPS